MLAAGFVTSTIAFGILLIGLSAFFNPNSVPANDSINDPALVSVTFYLRQRIGYRMFRVIHYASFVAYLAALVHGWMAGTDSPLGTVQLIYAGSALVVIFLFVHRIFMALPSLQLETR